MAKKQSSRRPTTGPLVPAFHGNIDFNAQHSAPGAFFSFTCGKFNSRGGFGLQSGKPGNQDLYIGIKDGDRFSDAPLKVLPFYAGAQSDEAKRYDVEGQSEANAKPQTGLQPYMREQIRRHYGWGTDRWVTDDFEFAIHTPFEELNHPSTTGAAWNEYEIIPAVYATLTIDNRRGKKPKTAFFAINFNAPGVRLMEARDGSFNAGFGWKSSYGVGVEPFVEGRDYDEGRESYDETERFGACQTFCRFSLQDGLLNATAHHLGNVPGVCIPVPAGVRRSFRIVLAGHVGGIATTRVEGHYWYVKQYPTLEHVLDIAIARHSHAVTVSSWRDRELLSSGLSPDQQFLIAHATRSYYGSTQLLDVGGEPFWVVNEGEYCMLNTLDLSVDHVFWELKQNPWVIRNLLDNFVRHYSYVDQVKVPKKSALKLMKQQSVHSEDVANTPRTLGTTIGLEHFDLKPGGISFCHDMGVNNNFSPRGSSSYELPNLVGCFSYMTAEQLCNWSLIAACYVSETNDLDWLRLNQHVIEACLNSMINRGGDAGFCQYDSSRCETGSEITTYDSLDHSLAQTRNNVYMATKSWATYLGLKLMLDKLGSSRGKEALDAAKKVEATVLANIGPDGVLPAVFEKDNPGNKSRILPAVEGLIYPWFWKDPILKSPSKFVKALRRHTEVLLKDKQSRNFFSDGGIRLSSTSDNSWMSKIAIFMHVCRAVFGMQSDKQIAGLFARADAAHVRWQTEGESAYWACSDQMVNGVAKGSKYYPRIITSALWLGASTR
jgi:xylan 1,4-beta-xylosidase